nr:MAG TPA_asm: hypothetical protein [Caudoviricetes sp.]
MPVLISPLYHTSFVPSIGKICTNIQCNSCATF